MVEVLQHLTTPCKFTKIIWFLLETLTEWIHLSTDRPLRDIVGPFVRCYTSWRIAKFWIQTANRAAYPAPWSTVSRPPLLPGWYYVLFKSNCFRIFLNYNSFYLHIQYFTTMLYLECAWSIFKTCNMHTWDNGNVTVTSDLNPRISWVK